MDESQSQMSCFLLIPAPVAPLAVLLFLLGLTGLSVETNKVSGMLAVAMVCGLNAPVLSSLTITLRSR